MTIDNCEQLFTGCHLYTAQGGKHQIIEQGAIATKGEIIVWLGKESDIPKALQQPSVARHQLKQGWITPGLIDCHSHIVYGGNRSNEFKQRLEGASYEEIALQGGGILSTVTATRNATEQSLFSSASGRIETLIKEGVTTVEIKSGYGLNLETEMKMLRVARQLADKYPLDVSTTFLAAHALPPEYKGKSDDYISLIIDEMLPEVVNHNLADSVDAFCENIGFTPEQVDRLFNAAKKYNLPVKLHAEQLSNQGGYKLAASHQALSADHLEYLDEEGVKSMAANGTVAVLLPGAFYYLRETKLPPLDLLRKHGVPIAVATDSNPGSSPCSSLLLMLNMACTQFKMTTDEVLMGVTKNAAKALGLQNKLGQLKVGMQADFVHWDIEQPEDLAYYFGSNPCSMVVKKGNIL
ncbi:MAG: imidazolonepropionase [Enterobacterales bacterium]|jgi:imidazolonepropionase